MPACVYGLFEHWCGSINCSVARDLVLFVSRAVGIRLHILWVPSGRWACAHTNRKQAARRDMIELEEEKKIVAFLVACPLIQSRLEPCCKPVGD